MKGYIVYPTYRQENGRADIFLFGKLENGESFQSIHTFRPYFFIRQADLEEAKGLGDFEHEGGKIKNFDGESLTKITLDLPKDVPELRKKLEDSGLATYEADIRYAYRFLMDHELLGTLDIDGEFEKGERVDRIYHNPKIKPSTHIPELTVLSIDIETSMDGKSLYCISLATDKVEHTLIISDEAVKGCEIFANERALLERCRDLFLEIDPDVITGWNVIDFDFSFLRDRYIQEKIPFSFGRIDWENKLRLNSDFFRDSTADIAGRMVIDGIHLLKNSFVRLENYKLSTASKVFLGDKKLLGDEDKGNEIDRLFKEDKAKLAAYNLKDAQLVLRIIEKSGTMHLTILRSLLAGMPLERVAASIASLDSLYLRELRRRGYAAQSGVYVEKESPITGGYVMQSNPGVYDYVLVLDFKSLYPSVMRTFNIDPFAFVRDKKKAKKIDCIESPNGAWFRREPGILPLLLQQLWEKRDAAKKRDDKAGSTAIKLLMNSFFGVLASPNCRFFSMDMANAITTFGQHLIKLTSDKVKGLGHEVIYGDTDSVFVRVNEDNEAGARKAGKAIEKEINAFFKDHITNDYLVTNYMELEFEKMYRRFWMPAVRGSDRGSKKRYAGLLMVDGKEKMDVVGLELVRRDWTDLAKGFQMTMLERLFAGEPVGDYIRDFVKDLKAGKLDDKLVYRKALRKSLADYTKTTPPHVKAARKLPKVTSSIIEYIMTINGPEPLEILKSPIDYAHYLEKQLKPLAESILSATGEKFDDFASKTKQVGLGDFS
ncbi:MAG: DNA polymerase II [archaeon]